MKLPDGIQDTEVVIVDPMLATGGSAVEAINIVKEQGYSYEVESDHHDWDQAEDGIETLREALRKLQEQG